MIVPLILAIVVALTLLTGVPCLRDKPRLAAISLTLAAMMFAGQTFGISRMSYPFDAWRMYASPSAPRDYFLFQVVTQDQQTLDYPFHTLTPWSPGPLRGYSMLAPVTWRLVDSQRRCRCAAHDPDLDRLLDALVRWAEYRSSREITRFEILRASATPAASTAPVRVYEWVKGSNRRPR